jgi:hypothetical protein
VDRNLLRRHCERKLNETLQQIELLRPGLTELPWTGTLSSDEDGRLKIVLESQANVMGLLNDGESGTIVTQEQLFTLRAQTADGLEIEAAGIYPSKPHISPFDYVKLEFLPGAITVRSETELPDLPWLIGAISPFAQNYACWHSEVRAFPPMVGTPAEWHQWYCLKFGEVFFALSKTRNRSCSFAIWKEEEGFADLTDEARSFLFALGIRVGQRVGWSGHTTVRSGRLETVLREPIPMHSASQHSPLPTDVSEADEQRLIGCAYRYFLSDENYPVANLFGMLWDTTDNFFPVQLLTAGTVIEGLADFIMESSSPSAGATEFSAFKTRVVAHLNTFSATDATEKALLEKFRRVVNSTQRLSLQDKVRAAAAAAKVVITDEELRAWNALRNRLAHGDFSPNSLSVQEVQRQSRQLDCAWNVINKLFLGMIGYRGDYTDFSSAGWPARSLPISGDRCLGN